MYLANHRQNLPRSNPWPQWLQMQGYVPRLFGGLSTGHGSVYTDNEWFSVPRGRREQSTILEGVKRLSVQWILRVANERAMVTHCPQEVAYSWSY